MVRTSACNSVVRAHTYVGIHIELTEYMYTYTYICTCLHTYKHRCMYIIYIYIIDQYVYICSYIYLRIDIRKHGFIYTLVNSYTHGQYMTNLRYKCNCIR